MYMPETEGKRRICVATNIFNIDPIPYASHLSLMYRLGRNLTNWDVIFVGPWRIPIDVARNRAATIALEEKCEYLFFYDDDMVVHPNVVQLLLDRVAKQEIHVISALVYIRGYPFKPMLFRFDEPKYLGLFDYKPEDIEENGLIAVDAVGCAATLIDCELFKMTPKPWFLTGEKHTEDVYFCMKAKDHIEGVKIYMDTQVECGHMLDKPVLTQISREVLLEIQNKGVDQLWQPNFSGPKEKFQTFVEENFTKEEFDVKPKG